MESRSYVMFTPKLSPITTWSKNSYFTKLMKILVTCQFPIPPYFSSIVSLIILAHYNKIFATHKSVSVQYQIIIRMFLHNTRTQFLTFQLHFVWHIRLSDQGIWKHNSSTHLKHCLNACVSMDMKLTSPSSFLAAINKCRIIWNFIAIWTLS